MKSLLSSILSIFLLAGCGTLYDAVIKTGQVLMDPSIQVGPPEAQPTRITLSLYADFDVNPNPDAAMADQVPEDQVSADESVVEMEVDSIDEMDAHGAEVGQYQSGLSMPWVSVVARSEQPVATPIAFRIVQLKDDSLFLNASAEALAQDLKKALGSSYLAVDDYVLLPGQFKFIHTRPIDEDAYYLAVIADFHDARAVWKDVIDMEPVGRNYALHVMLQRHKVSIADASRRPPLSSPGQHP